MLTACLLMMVLAVPGYALMIRFPSFAVICGVMAVMSMLNGFFATPTLISITEGLPPAIRSSALGILYALVMATFGASTQFNVKWLTDVTGNLLTPAWYLAVALALGAAAMAFSRETAPVKTGDFT
jgi:hypothetical protein